MAARPRMHSTHETRDLLVRRMRLHCAEVSCAPHVICSILLLFLLHIIVLHIAHDGGGTELRSNSVSVCRLCFFVPVPIFRSLARRHTCMAFNLVATHTESLYRAERHRDGVWDTMRCCYAAAPPFVNRKWIQLILDTELIWLCWYLLCGTSRILNLIAHSFLLVAFHRAMHHPRVRESNG